MRNDISFSAATCNQVLQWMVAHENTLPVLLKKPTTDAQRAERLLRRQFNYLKRKKNDEPPEVLALFEQIERNTTCSYSIATCKQVLEWLVAHGEALPVQLKRPTTDAQRAELVLGNRINNLKRKTHQPLVVRGLLDQIESRVSHQPDMKMCLAVLDWMDAHDNDLPMERKVFASKVQRDECILARRWRNFKRRKSHSPETITLLAKIQSRSCQAPVSCRLRAGHVAMQAKKEMQRKHEK
jgi:aromatic ring-cleaving dioxygenase